ncbi:MAG: ATP-binding protein [Oleiphilaceae bacterium]|nr:ATP-binding protein [Oleiphilaceae bacterium]
MTEIDWQTTRAAVYRGQRQTLRPVRRLDPIGWDQLQGIGPQKAAVAENTERFLSGKPANHCLLWGARGTGKSSLVKAMLNRYAPQGLRLIEVDRDDLVQLPEIVDALEGLPQRFVVYCDDLAFSAGESGYRALKSVLEGSIELPPENVLVMATSNRRHLLPESMADNRNSDRVDGEIHPAEAIEEQVSLSDRFGLWLSFYPFRQNTYLQAVDALFPGVADRQALHRAALQFALARGGRSGRTAQQFYRHYAGLERES